MKKTALLTALLCLAQSSLHADVPVLMNYQGKVADASGLPIGATGTAASYTPAPTNRKIIFRIYNVATGGTPLWAEEQTATLSSGVFSVLLGNGIAASGLAAGGSTTLASEQAAHTDLSAVFAGKDPRFLEIVVNNGTGNVTAADVPVSPRQQITSTAFAFHAKVADSIASAADLTINPVTGTASNYGLGWYGTGRTFNSIAVDGPVLYGNAGGALGSNVNGTKNLALLWNAAGNVGIGTTTPAYKLDINSGDATGLRLGPNGSYSESLLLGGWNDTDFTQARIQTSNGNLHLDAKSGHNLYLNNFHNGPVLLAMGGGKVGIGAASPLGRLHLYEATGSVAGINSGSLILEHGNAGGASSITFRSCGNITSDYASIQYQDASTLGGAGEASKLIISTQNDFNDDICLMPSGNVGIGTTAPQFKLDVYSGDAAGIRLGPNDSFSNSLLLGGWNAQDHTVARIQSSNGTLLLDSMNGFGIRLNTLANGDVILATGGGRVGIGTVAPAAPLHVAGYAPVAGYLEWVTKANSSYNPGHWWWTVPVSILSENVVRAGELHIISDARIKDIKKVSDGGADLATLMKIEVTDYVYKDVVARGNRPQKKVVAQQVEKIYPQAVSRSTDVVPDIFKKATVKDGWVELASDLKVGERVKLMSEKDQSVHEVLELRKGGFRTDWKEDTENLFVYGREVKDFRSVDYDAIAMLNVSATQQLAKQLKEKDAKIAALDASNAALVTSNAALDAKVAALGAKFAALEKLLSKAR